MVYTYSYNISIHAPARGATTLLCPGIYYMQYFNPRSREGSDLLVHSDLPPYSKFQSTLPRGERLPAVFNLLLVCNFNPRSREGSDAISSSLLAATL